MELVTPPSTDPIAECVRTIGIVLRRIDIGNCLRGVVTARHEFRRAVPARARDPGRMPSRGYSGVPLWNQFGLVRGIQVLPPQRTLLSPHNGGQERAPTQYGGRSPGHKSAGKGRFSVSAYAGPSGYKTMPISRQRSPNGGFRGTKAETLSLFNSISPGPWTGCTPLVYGGWEPPNRG
jgi:hypothetical protein